MLKDPEVEYNEYLVTEEVEEHIYKLEGMSKQQFMRKNDQINFMKKHKYDLS